jgi:hypothetical protein
MAGSHNMSRSIANLCRTKNNTGHSKPAYATLLDSGDIAAWRAWNAAAVRRLLAGRAAHPAQCRRHAASLRSRRATRRFCWRHGCRHGRVSTPPTPEWRPLQRRLPRTFQLGDIRSLASRNNLVAPTANLGPSHDRRLDASLAGSTACEIGGDRRSRAAPHSADSSTGS